MTRRSDQELVINDLAVAVFRLNGRLVEVGNKLVEDIGLTDAWWQVLGAIASVPAPLPVAHIARHMGLSRQEVHRIVSLLSERGLVRFAPNPHHQRAQLVVLTAEGWAAEHAAQDRWHPWAQGLEAAVGPERLAAALDVLRQVEMHLTNATDASHEVGEFYQDTLRHTAAASKDSLKGKS